MTPMVDQANSSMSTSSFSFFAQPQISPMMANDLCHATSPQRLSALWERRLAAQQLPLL